MSSYFPWRPYVPVAQRRAQAAIEKRLSAATDLERLFGIDLDAAPAAVGAKAKAPPRARGSAPQAAAAPTVAVPPPPRRGRAPVKPAPMPPPATSRRAAARPTIAAKTARVPPQAAAKSPRRRVSPPTITTADLLAAGIPRTTFQNWVTKGILGRTAERGVYLRTPAAEARIRESGRAARGG